MNDQPTEKHYTVDEKDTILRDAFRRLEARGFDSAWSEHPTPFTSIVRRASHMLLRMIGNVTYPRLSCIRQKLMRFILSHSPLSRFSMTCLFRSVRRAVSATNSRGLRAGRHRLDLEAFPMLSCFELGGIVRSRESPCLRASRSIGQLGLPEIRRRLFQ